MAPCSMDALDEHTMHCETIIINWNKWGEDGVTPNSWICYNDLFSLSYMFENEPSWCITLIVSFSVNENLTN